MSKHARDRRPYVKPVKRIELSEKNIKLRWILIVVLLSIAVVSVIVGLTAMLNVEPGWQEVEASAQNPSCAGEFVLMYDFSDAGSGATALNKRLTSLYTEAVENAYRIFSADVLEEGLGNVAWLNAHVNESVTVEPALYQALTLAAQYSDRHIFTAPAMPEYNRVFLCENDGEAALYDPARNAETAAWLEALSRYVSDPEMVSLDILGENQVQLNVSEAYLAFAQENEIGTFLDFGWMANAFIADYLADVLTENGFTSGYLASYDGFTRNLDTRGGTYSVNIFDAQGTEVFMPARMHYSGNMSIVFLRNYPLDDLDKWHYYVFESGEIVTAFLDPADCMSKSAVDSLVSYSSDAGCAEILLQIANVFIADDFETETFHTLTDRNIYTVWCEGTELKYNDADLALEQLTGNGGEGYRISLEK